MARDNCFDPVWKKKYIYKIASLAMVTAAVFDFLRVKRGSDTPGHQSQESLWLAVQVSWSVHEKRTETKACRCGHHDLTHLTRLLLVVILCLCIVPFETFYQTYSPLEEAALAGMVLKKSSLIISTVCMYIRRQVFPFTQVQNVQAC